MSRRQNMAIDPEQHYGLVYHLAKEIHNSLGSKGAGIELNELAQWGFLGLCKAAGNYDSAKGRFAPYASLRIKGAILDYLRSLDLVNQDERKALRELEEARDQLTKSLQREPTVDECAAALGVAPEEVLKIEDSRLVEEQVDWGDGAPPPTSASPSQEADLHKVELADALQECLRKALDVQERAVLKLRYFEGLILDEVGRILNRPLTTIHNVGLRARKKMKVCMQRKGWDLADVDG